MARGHFLLCGWFIFYVAVSFLAENRQLHHTGYRNVLRHRAYSIAYTSPTFAGIKISPSLPPCMGGIFWSFLICRFESHHLLGWHTGPDMVGWSASCHVYSIYYLPPQVWNFWFDQTSLANRMVGISIFDWYVADHLFR